jgi:hypothetical protein
MERAATKPETSKPSSSTLEMTLSMSPKKPPLAVATAPSVTVFPAAAAQRRCWSARSRGVGAEEHRSVEGATERLR